MATVNKIDSNVTALRYAEEDTFKTLGTSPIWKALEPNSYQDFGGNITTVARTPISADRQRKKGVTSDLESAGGFNNDLTQTNLQDLLQGFFFSNFRRKGEQLATAVNIDGANPDKYEMDDTSNFKVDDLVLGSGFSNSQNNTLGLITGITVDTNIEVSSTLIDEVTPPTDAQLTVVGHNFQTGEVDIDASTVLPRLVRVSGVKDFTTFGLSVGEFIFIGGDENNKSFTTANNNGFKRIRKISTDYIEFDKSDTAMVTEVGTTVDVRIFFGRVLKNEVGSNIVRRTYQLERDLGAPDDSSTDTQAEYIVGAVPNELSLNISTADKITVDMSFVGADHEMVSAGNKKTGTRPNVLESNAFNTSSDFSRIKMAEVDESNEAPTPLFAFVTEMTLNLNNNVSPNKAIGTLGSFDSTAGLFQVSGDLTAYFSNVSAISAVRNNSNITLDLALVKDNSGIVVDIPLITLSDSRANVEQDSPITLPITKDAVSGSTIDPELNHTLLMVFFDYLPDIADV
jgi:hypothetical protein